jgi:hypothetical protein
MKNEKERVPILPYTPGKTWGGELLVLASTLGFYSLAVFWRGDWNSAMLWWLVLVWELACFRSEFRVWLFVRHQLGHDKHWTDGLNLPEKRKI